VYSQYRNDAGWSRCLALHRHGGIEVGIGHLAYTHREVRVFPLRPIVGLAWITAALQAEAAERWALSGPFEITVALRDTSRATLGSFAEGWAEPGYGLAEFSTCLDEHLLLRKEVDGAIDPMSLAIDLGDRVEQAFGSVEQ